MKPVMMLMVLTVIMAMTAVDSRSQSVEKLAKPFNESAHLKEQSDGWSNLCAGICAKADYLRTRYHAIT